MCIRKEGKRQTEEGEWKLKGEIKPESEEERERERERERESEEERERERERESEEERGAILREKQGIQIVQNSNKYKFCWFGI